jgi:nucleoside phosphorylase
MKTTEYEPLYEIFFILKLFVTALHLEARVFLTGLGLKKDNGSKRIPLYRGGDISLAVSGTGKINAASTTAWALEHIGVAGCAGARAVNFGLCGCDSVSIPAGTLFLANKITDVSSGRTFYPDILQKHGLPEAAVETHDRPVERSGFEEQSNNGHTEPRLVDMEASGFFGAAATFLPPERISCLKLVSDHLEGRPLDKSSTSALIASCWADLNRFLQQPAPALPEPPGMSEDDRLFLAGITANLRLTETQQHQIQDWARSFTIRTKGAALPLRQFHGRTAKGKTQRNQILRDIKDELLAS